MKKHWLMLISLFILIVPSVLVNGQRTLPSDLYFTAADVSASAEQPTMKLIRLDAATMTTSTFYTDTEAVDQGLQLLSWSPTRKLLAIFRNMQSKDGQYKFQLCTLTLQGTLQVCMDDSPTAVSGSGLEDQLKAVSWSSDGTRLYFANELNNKVRLLEADALSGHTLRVLYEYPDDGQEGVPPLLTWTSTLDYVAVGVGDSGRTIMHLPEFLFNINTHEQIDFYSVVTAPAKLVRVCVEVSPKNAYLTAIGQINDLDTELIVFDKAGTVVHVIDKTSGFGKLGVTCPNWQPNEAAFYFAGNAESDERASVFRYSLKDKILSVVARVPDDIDLRSNSTAGRYIASLAIAPDNSTLAAMGIDNPHLGGNVQVAVLTSDGQVKNYLDSYFYTSYPIWAPTISLVTAPTATKLAKP